MAKNINVLLRESGKIRKITACTGWKVLTITVDDGWYRDNYASFMAPAAVLPSQPGGVAAAGGAASASSFEGNSVSVGGVTGTVAGLAGEVSRNILGGDTPQGYPLTHDPSGPLTMVNNPDEVVHANPRVKSFRVSMTVFFMAGGLDVIVNTAAPYSAATLTTVPLVAAMIPTLNIESIDDGAGT